MEFLPELLFLGVVVVDCGDRPELLESRSVKPRSQKKLIVCSFVHLAPPQVHLRPLPPPGSLPRLREAEGRR